MLARSVMCEHVCERGGEYVGEEYRQWCACKGQTISAGEESSDL